MFAVTLEWIKSLSVHSMRNYLDAWEVEGRIFLLLLLNGIIDLLFTKVGVDHEARDACQRRDALRINWAAIDRAVKDDRRNGLRLSQFLQVCTLNPDIVDNEDQLRLDFFNQFDKANLLDGPAAMRYRKLVMEPGGSKSASDLVKDFLGRPQSYDAFRAWMNEEFAEKN